jgi:adenosylmethionine-8-amino-7-oxononanoate aminotransferase
MFAPPLVIEPPQIEQIGERLEQALDDVAIELKNEGSF